MLYNLIAFAEFLVKFTFLTTPDILGMQKLDVLLNGGSAMLGVPAVSSYLNKLYTDSFSWFPLEFPQASYSHFPRKTLPGYFSWNICYQTYMETFSN